MEINEINVVTEQILGCAFKVSNTLGVGYLEKVYENALAHEMRKCGLRVAQQVKLEVFYDGVNVGFYLADLVVEGCVLIELKTADAIIGAHIAQALNYLKTTQIPLCLILNFGTSRLEIKRLRS